MQVILHEPPDHQQRLATLECTATPARFSARDLTRTEPGVDGTFYARSLAARRPSPDRSSRAPRIPIRGSWLPVLGSVGAETGAAAATSAGGGSMGRTITTRIGRSTGGSGGGGGRLPVTSFCCSTTVSGTSMTLVADTVIPFFRPHASTIW